MADIRVRFSGYHPRLSVPIDEVGNRYGLVYETPDGGFGLSLCHPSAGYGPMIRFSLECHRGHHFESWFKSNSAYDSLSASKLLECPVCGSSEVNKTLMTPRLRIAKKSEKPENCVPQEQLQPAEHESKAAHALKKLKSYVEENSEYVGTEFASEARAIHSGEAPSRAIFGEAQLAEARNMVDEGIPIAPLPWIPTCKSN